MLNTQPILNETLAGVYLDGQWLVGRELGPWGMQAFQEIKHVIRAL